MDAFTQPPMFVKCVNSTSFLSLRNLNMFSLRDSIDSLRDAGTKLRLVQSGLTLDADKGIIGDIVEELGQVEAMLKRLKKEGIE